LNNHLRFAPEYDLLEIILSVFQLKDENISGCLVKQSRFKTLRVAQLLEKFPAFNETRTFITALTAARY
jgi:hypothetical protein